MDARRAPTADTDSSGQRYGERAGPATLSGRLKVWIDQDLCTGDGICTDHAPQVFTILEDGIAYCRQDDRIFNDPGGAAELAVVDPSNESRVIHAAAECPGECIFVEFEDYVELEN
ncbi:MAG: ferredoxin [Acidimicrobiales bacterium]